jgi:hypothetical protein
MGLFDFGGSSGVSYEDMVRRRAIAVALAGRQKGFPKNKGEGLTYLGDAFAEAMGELALRQKEEAYKKETDKIGKGAPTKGYEPKTSYDQKDEKPFPKAASDDAYNKDRPTVKSEPPPPPQTPPQTAPPPAATGGWEPPPQTMAPWPVSEADPSSFSDRFAAADAPVEGAIPVQTVAEQPAPTRIASAAAPSPEYQAMFFSPQMQASMTGGTKPDLSPDTAPATAAQAAQPAPAAQAEQVTLPTETSKIPLPMGDPRTTGGVRATMEAIAARGGATPNFIGGMERAVRDESNFNPNLRHPDQPKFSGEAHYAHGLFQEGGDEWNNYVKWLDKNHPDAPWQDPKLQTQFLMERLQDPSRADYNRTFTAMQNAPTSGAAADALTRGYLKPAEEYREARGAQYRQAEGMPVYNNVAVGASGGGGGSQVAGMRVAPGGGRIGGAPAQDELATQRDAVTAALMQQQVKQPPTQEEASADTRLLEAVGGGRKPGTPFYPPTAALGRAGVTADVAQPGLSPMGALGGTGVDASVEARRNAISDALQNQPATAPEVPPENPTQPGTTPSPTTASLPPSTAGVVSSDMQNTVPMGALAQNSIPLGGYPSIPGGGTRMAQEPGPAIPDIRPAPPPPPPQQQAVPPSDLPIPPEVEQQFPKYGPAPKAPGPFPLSETQKYWEPYLSHPDPRIRQKAEHAYNTEEKFRTSAEAKAWEEYKNLRESHEANVKAERDFDLKKPERQLDTRIKRLAIEEAIAKAGNRPEEALKLKADREKAQQELEDLRYKATIQRDQEQRQRELTIKKTEQDINKGKIPVREKIGDQLFERQDDNTWLDVTPGSVGLKLTETQAKTLKFYERAKVAESQLGDTSVLAGFKNSAAGRVPMVGNYFVTPEYQKAKSAADAWMLATLRDESGAVIGVAELPQFYPVYFPLPGDSPQTIADKNERRANATRSLADALGSARPAADKFDEQFKARATTEPEGSTRTKKSGERQRVRGGRWEDY